MPAVVRARAVLIFFAGADSVAILQALFALITRSAGKILNAIFGWAVHALFGKTTPRDQTLLSALVGAAVVWPLLVAGIAAPKVAALVLAFAPIPHAVPSWLVRLVWLALTLAVPVTMGLTLAARSRAVGHESAGKRILRGFPLTLGLALAFLIMFVSVPVMRFVAMVRREKTADIPLVTDAAAYHQVAAQVIEMLGRHGYDLRPAEPSWWVKAPTRILGWFGGAAFSGFVPMQLEHYVSEQVELSFYTSGVLLRGKGQRATLMQGLIAEATVHGAGLQTFSPAAQDLERHVRRLWRRFDAAPDAHVGSAWLLARVRELSRELGRLDVDYDEWQVVYRQLLQLERAVRGEAQLLDDEALDATDARSAAAMAENEEGIMNREREDTSQKSATAGSVTARPAEETHDPASLSTPQLLKEIGHQVTTLVKTELELAKNELRANVRSEAKMTAGLGIGALAALTAVNLLLVTAILALAQVLPGWAAGLIVSGAVLALAAIAGLVGWSKRVQKPLDRTRRELKEDVQWTKEHVA